MNIKWDHLAEQQSDRLFASWLKLLMRESPTLPLALAQKHRPKARAVEASAYTAGSYNLCSTVSFDDGHRVIVRFPIMGRSRFRCEKTDNELVVMRYVAQNTRIPVPIAIGAGMWACGPYVVMTVVEGTLLSKSLGDPTDISESTLERAFAGMAHVLVELSKPEFPAIGALGWEADEWKVQGRPLSLNMNELVRVGNYPPDKLIKTHYSTATDYFKAFADHHCNHLEYQRNDVIHDKQDYQKKFIARCLFKKIAERLPDEPGPYRLYCDDLRPSNVLVSGPDLLVTGVIDWEFTYIAPAEFSYTAPWWLLFEALESWESDLNMFLTRYRPRLQLFLRVLRGYEDKLIEKGSLKESQRLSGGMEESLENGLFWFCLAARKSFMFDDIYWTFLHEKYFGSVGTIDEMASLLSQKEQDEMAELAEVKLRQAEEDPVLDEHMTFDQIFEL